MELEHLISFDATYLEDKKSFLTGNLNSFQPIHHIIHEESSIQIENTYSEDKRTSKEQIDSSQCIIERSDDDSIFQKITSYLGRTKIRKSDPDLYETNDCEENLDLDTRYNEKLESVNSLRFDKENQAVVSESSDECNINSPAKNSVYL